MLVAVFGAPGHQHEFALTCPPFRRSSRRCASSRPRRRDRRAGGTWCSRRLPSVAVPAGTPCCRSPRPTTRPAAARRAPRRRGSRTAGIAAGRRCRGSRAGARTRGRTTAGCGRRRRRPSAASPAGTPRPSRPRRPCPIFSADSGVDEAVGRHRAASQFISSSSHFAAMSAPPPSVDRIRARSENLCRPVSTT